MGAQLGLEKTPEEYVANMVQVFREVKRVLRDEGTLWINLGDSYAAQRGGTVPPAETLAGGVNGRGGEDSKRGRSDGYNASRNAGAIGLKHKDLCGIPWRVAFALQADGWYLRQDIIWHKPNPMPESVTDRCTKAHEYIFLLSKSARYYFDADAIAEPATYSGITGMDATGFKYPSSFNGKHKNLADKGLSIHGMHKRRSEGYPEPDSATRNKRSVWTVTTKPFSGAHFATFPPDLIEPCILAGSKPGDTVLDPFGGSGTTGMVAESLGRNWVLIELNPEYEKLSRERTAQTGMVFA
jgi:DNA modification methylase